MAGPAVGAALKRSRRDHQLTFTPTREPFPTPAPGRVLANECHGTKRGAADSETSGETPGWLFSAMQLRMRTYINF